jgi:K+-transporting ATPase KdpF subunit
MSIDAMAAIDAARTRCCLMKSLHSIGVHYFLGAPWMLYLTALTAVASLVYLIYAMLRPERF